MRRSRLSAPTLLLVAVAVLTLTASVGWASCRAFTAMNQSIITFDFDTGSPTLPEGRNTPFNQTSSGVTASFSSPSDSVAPAFSIQSAQTWPLIKLSQFSGKYLYDNQPSRDFLDIKFSRHITSINLTFATIETDVEPSTIKLTAYIDSTGTTPVGSAQTTGTLPQGDTYPQGILSFTSTGQSFNLVRIQLVPLGHPYEATDYFVDNVIIITAPDTTPPVTTVSPSGVSGDQGWFVSNVTVNLSATDDWSGVVKTEYSFDNVTWANYTAPFIISNEGTTTIYYRSTDAVGNIETVKMQSVKIDKTVPTGSIVVNNDDASTNSTSVTLTLTSNDAFSGVSQVRYSNDGVWDTEQWEAPSPTKTWTLTAGNGTKNVYYQIKDNAGLVSLTYQDSIVLEAPPPIVDTTKPVADAGPDQTVNEDTLVTFDGSNSTDNVAVTTYTWSFTDITTKTLTGSRPTYTFNTPGVYTVTLNITDVAGNWATDAMVVTVLDVTPPVAEAGTNQTVNEDTKVILDGSGSTDNVGVANYTWKFTDGTPRTLTGVKPNYTFATPGIYVVTLNVTDAAGNYKTDTVTITVKDVTPPTANAGNDQTVRVNTQVSLNCGASSDNVGIVNYTWNFGDGTTGIGVTTTHMYTQAGTFTITLTVSDAAGNSNTDTAMITVQVEPEFPWTTVGIGATIAISAVGVSVYLLLRRKS